MKNFKRIFTAILAVFTLILPLCVCANEGDERSKRRMDTVLEFTEDALRYARYNVPGAIYPHILVNGYSVDTKKPVEWKYQGGTYYPSNLISQQNFLRVLVGLTNLTGEQRYRDIAEEQVKFWFKNYVDKNGLLYGGEHTLVDVKTGKILSYLEHELKQVFPYWEFMYEADPEGIRRYLDGCWNSHIRDWSNLSMNRHGLYNEPMSDMWDSEYTDTSIDFNNGHNLAFQNAGDDFMNFAFFISEKTGEEKPKIWARRMLQKFMDTVNPDTGLSGAQYGEIDGEDRLYLQYGPEFGELAKEYNFINKYKIKTIAGYVPQYLIKYAQSMNDQEVMDYIINSVEGTAKYVYDAENHKLKTPMWSDTTSLRGYVLKRAGYQGVAGKKLADGETTHPEVFHGVVQTYLAAERELIWQFARDLGKGFGVGDIGTAPGENVNLDMETTSTSTEVAFTLLDLYYNTGCSEYLTLAEKIGENMIDAYIEFKEGRTNLSYMAINREDMVALLRIEAAVRNLPDAVDNGIVAAASVEFAFDGVARTTDHAMFWSKTRVPATRVDINGGEIVVPVNTARIPAFNDIAQIDEEQAIRALYSIGAVSGVSEESFAPDRSITRAEFVSILVKLCAFPERTKKFDIYADVSADAWYRDAVEAARNNGLIDEGFLKNGLFAPNEYITNEEMIGLVVRALTSINKNTQYNGYNAIKKLSDCDEVSEWVREYVDIACNYALITDTKLLPKECVTRGQAAAMLIRLNDMIGRDFKDVTATVFPSSATKQYVNWTSSDESIFSVDKNGRIYPVSEGVATLTAEVDGVTDTRSVHIISLEDYMLKYIKLDGVDLPEFVPDKMEYEVNLLLGTKKFPEITAETYSGISVKVETTDEFPGTATIIVGETGKKYTLNFIAEKIDYKMNDDFEGYLLDVGLHNMWTGDVLWGFNSVAWSNGEAPVTIQNRPESETPNKCLPLPYHKGFNIEVKGVFEDKPYFVGPEAEDELIVFDFDWMVTAPLEGFEARIGSEKWPVKLTCSDNTFYAVTGDGSQELGTYKPGEYENIKIVIHKKTMAVDWYYNNALVLEEQDAISVGTYDKLTKFMLLLKDPESEMGTMVYIDNVKLYQLPAEYADLITNK